jgi:hypothetical protein
MKLAILLLCVLKMILSRTNLKSRSSLNSSEGYMKRKVEKMTLRSKNENKSFILVDLLMYIMQKDFTDERVILYILTDSPLNLYGIPPENLREVTEQEERTKVTKKKTRVFALSFRYTYINEHLTKLFYVDDTNVIEYVLEMPNPIGKKIQNIIKNHRKSFPETLKLEDFNNAVTFKLDFDSFKDTLYYSKTSREDASFEETAKEKELSMLIYNLQLLPQEFIPSAKVGNKEVVVKRMLNVDNFEDFLPKLNKDKTTNSQLIQGMKDVIIENWKSFSQDNDIIKEGDTDSVRKMKITAYARALSYKLYETRRTPYLKYEVFMFVRSVIFQNNNLLKPEIDIVNTFNSKVISKDLDREFGGYAGIFSMNYIGLVVDFTTFENKIKPNAMDIFNAVREEILKQA